MVVGRGYLYGVYRKKSRLCSQDIMYRSNRSFNIPTPSLAIPRVFDTFAVPGRREFDYQSLPGGGEFELHPRFHVKSLVWRAVMGDVVLEDFLGNDCAFVANWLQGLCRI